MKSVFRLFHRRCQDRQLSCYIDGELTPRQAARLERHLRNCPECRQELAQLRATTELLDAVAVPAMPRAVRIPAAAVRQQTQARRYDGLYLGLRAGAALVAVFMAVVLSAQAFGSVRLAGSSEAVAFSAIAEQDVAPRGMESFMVAEDDIAATVAEAEAPPIGAVSKEIVESAAVESEMAMEAPVEGEAEAPTAELPLAMLAEPLDATAETPQAEEGPGPDVGGGGGFPPTLEPEREAEVEAPAGESVQVEGTAAEEPEAEIAPLARVAPAEKAAEPETVMQTQSNAASSALAMDAEESLVSGAESPPVQSSHTISRDVTAWTLVVPAALLVVILGALAWVSRKRVHL